MIKLKNVSLRRNGKEILKPIDWQVNQGEHWAIMGLNGSGKTSLLNIIKAYHWPTTGEVELLGEKFGEANLPKLQKRIGWVSSLLKTRINPYEPVEKIILSGLFSSIGLYQNYGTAEEEQVEEMMRMLSIEHLQGQPYNRCSQGQQQIVLIARALVSKPDLLILDEPCNGLDIFATELVLTTIQKMIQTPNGPNILFVTHHTDQIIVEMENVLLLKNGEVFAKGKTNDLLTEEVLGQYYNEPVEVMPLKNGRYLVYLD